MLYFAKTVLNYTDAEFWKLTMRKYVALRDIHYDNNKPSEEQEVFCDDIL